MFFTNGVFVSSGNLDMRINFPLVLIRVVPDRLPRRSGQLTKSWPKNLELLLHELISDDEFGLELYTG